MNSNKDGAVFPQRVMSIERKFLAAAANGDKALIRLLLKKRANVRYADFSGRTALQFAAKNGHEAIVELLVERGANVASQDIFGQTALSSAAESGHKAVVELLLERGANIASEDDFGQTVLSSAAESGQKAVVELLLERGANIASEDNFGRTALQFAAKNGHKAVVELLVERGANIAYEDHFGRTALSSAAESGQKAVVELLLERGANIASKDTHGWTALLSAAENGHKAIVELLLERGANIASEDIHGQTALLSAAKNGHEAVVELLLERGANIASKDIYGRTALSSAVKSGHEAIVELLLKRGASIFFKDIYGQTVRLYAQWIGCDWALELLLKYVNTEYCDLYKQCQLIILLFNCLYSVFFFEWPDGQRLLITTMPWNIPPSLLVLWGVCWMFAPYGQEMQDETVTGERFMDTGLPQESNSSVAIHGNLGMYSSYDMANMPGDWGIASMPYPFLQDVHPVYNLSLLGEEYNSYPGLFQPIQTMHTMSQEIPINVSDNLLWDNNFVGSTIGPSEPVQAASILPCNTFQAEVTPHQHSSISTNGFQAQGEGQMTGFAVSPLPQTHQIPRSTPEPALPKRSFPSQPLLPQTKLSQSPFAVPPRSARKRMRLDPTPNADGQYLCTYEGCKKDNPGFRLPCHWHKHMDTHERIYPCLQPGCSKLEGFTSAGGLKRHEKQVHKMHGVVEYHCPHAGCSRAEGKGRPFTRKENRADHLRRQHNKHDNTPVKVNRPIAARPGVKEKGNSACNEVTQAPGENALLRATIEQLERRIEQLENARSG